MYKQSFHVASDKMFKKITSPTILKLAATFIQAELNGNVFHKQEYVE